MRSRILIALFAIVGSSACTNLGARADPNLDVLPEPGSIPELLDYPFVNVGDRIPVQFRNVSAGFVKLRDGSRVYNVSLSFAESEQLCLPKSLNDWPDIFDGGSSVLGRRNNGPTFLFARRWGYPNDSVPLVEVSEFSHSVTKIFRSNFAADAVKITLPVLRCEGAIEIPTARDQSWSYIQTDWIEVDGNGSSPRRE